MFRCAVEQQRSAPNSSSRDTALLKVGVRDGRTARLLVQAEEKAQRWSGKLGETRYGDGLLMLDRNNLARLQRELKRAAIVPLSATTNQARH